MLIYFIIFLTILLFCQIFPITGMGKSLSIFKGFQIFKHTRELPANPSGEEEKRPETYKDLIKIIKSQLFGYVTILLIRLSSAMLILIVLKCLFLRQFPQYQRN